MQEEDSYRVDILFKGLFLVWWQNGRLDILVPYARGPASCYVDPGRPLREHVLALEIPVTADWNKEDFVDELIFNQLPGGPPRHIIRLGGMGNEIAVLNDARIPHSLRPRGANSELCVVDDGSDSSIFQLARFDDAPNQNGNLSLSIQVTAGFVTSERRSTRKAPKGPIPHEWVEIAAPVVKAAKAAGILDALVKGLKNKARPLNLDLRVALAIAAKEPLRLKMPGSRELVIQTPPRNDRDCGPADIELLIRNQEFAAVFAEGTERGKEEQLSVEMDRDQEYYCTLAENEFDRLLIPVSSRYDDEDAPQGQGCGGTSGPAP